MKTFFCGFISIVLIITLSACGSSSLDKRITKEELVFVQEEKSVCDTELTVENKIVLKSSKDSNNKYIGEYQLYDCGDGAVYMTLSNGTYTLKNNTISFLDQYNQEYNFKITGKKEITLLDKSGKELKKFKLQVSTKSE